MTVNVWGTVGSVAFILPFETQLGTAFQLLGMNSTADAAQWKEARYNNTTHQFDIPVGSAATPSYTFAGDLNTGFYQDGADAIGVSAGGVRKFGFTTTLNTSYNNLAMNSKLFMEDVSVDIVAAATTDLGTATGNYVRITNNAGATNISDLGGATLPSGTCIETEFVIVGGSITLVYDANKIQLPGAANLVLQNGDVVRWRKTNDASNFWKLASFQRGLSTSGITNKGDIIVGTLSGGTIVPQVLPVGTDGQIAVASSLQAAGLIYTDYTRDPLNTNPNWLLDQINEGALYTIGASTQGPDGWTGVAVGTGVFKLRTLVDPDNAALRCLEITCTTADAAIAAADNYKIFTSIEGYDVADLKPGTASASQITIQFAFKSSVAGTYGVAVQNSATNRRYVGTIVVPDANEHTYILTLSLDTAGVWLYTNGTGLTVILTLAAGTNFQTAAPNAWGAGTEQTIAAQCNFMSNIANIAYLKRFHVLPGGVALAYHKQNIQRELAKAQRQYCKTFDQGIAPVEGVGTGTGGNLEAQRGAVANTEPVAPWFYPVAMRDIPTIILFNARPGGTTHQWGGTGVDSANARAIATGKSQTMIDNSGTTLASASQFYIGASANSRLS